MSTVTLIQYEDASPEVQAVFDDIKRTRNIPDVNNFWKALANHPETLRRTWEALAEIMKPGALDPLTKEMIYVAVSVANNCDYCIHSHTASARAKGMTEAQYSELLAVIGMASQTNALATAMKVPIDPQFHGGDPGARQTPAEADAVQRYIRSVAIRHDRGMSGKTLADVGHPWYASVRNRTGIA